MNINKNALFAVAAACKCIARVSPCGSLAAAFSIDLAQSYRS